MEDLGSAVVEGGFLLAALEEGFLLAVVEEDSQRDFRLLLEDDDGSFG